MPFYGDPDALDRLAGRLARLADDVRDTADDVSRRARATRWHGRAAAAFTAAVTEELARLESTAARLDEAATATRRLADEVRALLARIAAVERAVTEWFGEQARLLRQAADAVVDAVGDPLGTLRRAVTDPPWAGWRWQPGSLPLPGSREWLDVGEDLRHRGVPV